MTILQKVKKLANSYLKEGKKDYLLASKNIINAIQNKQKSQKEDLTEKDEIAVLKNLRKKSLESIEAFTKGNRLELAEKEKIDLSIIEKFLPKELSEEETKKLVESIFQKLKTVSIGTITMGSVMEELKFSDDVNMKLASQLVREKLK